MKLRRIQRLYQQSIVLYLQFLALICDISIRSPDTFFHAVILYTSRCFQDLLYAAIPILREQHIIFDPGFFKKIISPIHNSDHIVQTTRNKNRCQNCEQ